MTIEQCKNGARVKLIHHTQPPMETILGKTGSIKGIMQADVCATDGSVLFTARIPAVEFDQPFVGAHDCNGRCARNRGYYCVEDTLELVL